MRLDKVLRRMENFPIGKGIDIKNSVSLSLIGKEIDMKNSLLLIYE